MTRFKSALRSSAVGARSSPPGRIVPCPPAHSARPARRVALKFQRRIGKPSRPKAVVHQIHFNAPPLHGDAGVLGWQTGWMYEARAGRAGPRFSVFPEGKRLLLWFFWGLLLLLLLPALLLFGPRRDDIVNARIGDGLPEVFAEMPEHENHRSAIGGVVAKELELLFHVRIRKAHHCPADMRQRFVKRLNNFRFIRGGFFQSADIEAGGRARPDQAGKIVVCRGDVQIYLRDGAHTFTGPPGELLRRDRFRQSRVALLEVFQPVENFRAGSRCWSGCRGRRSLGSGLWIGWNGQGKTKRHYCKNSSIGFHGSPRFVGNDYSLGFCCSCSCCWTWRAAVQGGTTPLARAYAMARPKCSCWCVPIM